ncbi:MAG: glycosyltransferase family 2 protein [Bacteroidales bacterium]|nr:glycosyltransferase family 2 protein [Bacteroidales bacterium]
MDLSVVVSIYNEEEGIEHFFDVLEGELYKLPYTYEVLMINDGSRDNTMSELKKLSERNEHIRIVSFSRNFGHEAAMLAGIDNSRGKAIICMDSDLQHPPAKIAEMMKLWEKGAEVVTMVRSERKDDKGLHKWLSRSFYRLVNKLSDIKIDENASDFFLISDKVGDLLRKDYRERSRFLRGIVQSVGFRREKIEYVAEERKTGKSHYSFRKLVKLSLLAISSFSKVPLQIGIIVGLLFVLLSIVLLIYSLVMYFCQRPTSGYTTLIVFLSLFSGIQLMIIGIIGEYIGYIYDEVKGRPIYIIDKIYESQSKEQDDDKN